MKHKTSAAKPGKLPNLLLAYTIHARRPLEDDKPNGYQESLRDWAGNNAIAVEWFLENHAAISAALSSHANLVAALKGLMEHAAMQPKVYDSDGKGQAAFMLAAATAAEVLATESALKSAQPHA